MSNKNIVITGASKGIGRAITEAFAAEGANFFLCSKNEKLLQETTADLQARFPNSNFLAKASAPMANPPFELGRRSCLSQTSAFLTLSITC